MKVKSIGRDYKLTAGVKLLFKNPELISKVFAAELRSRVLLEYKLFNGCSFSPTSISLEITNRCNLGCKMCWLREREKLGFAYEELTTAEMFGIIDDIAKSNCFLCVITGGEPFLRKDILEIIRYIKEKGLICTVLTNGTVISKEINQELVNIGLANISFSVDGSEDVHDSVRGRGTFAKTLSGVKSLLEARDNKQFPLISLSTTISALNYHSLSEMVPLAQSWGVDELKIIHLRFVDRKQADAHKQAMEKLFGIQCSGIYGYVMDKVDIDIDVLASELSKVKNNRTGLIVSFYPEMNSNRELTQYYYGCSPLRQRCTAPWFGATIKPNGELCLCPDYYIPEYILGNLKERSLRELWNNERAKLFRSTLKKGLFPGCLRCCALFGY